MTLDPKHLVRDGYDAMAHRYDTWASDTTGGVKARYLEVVRSRAPAGGRALDLGCGAGRHVTRRLAEHFDVVGVDLSATSVSLAKAAVPSARFVVGDMATIAFRHESFVAVTAFFSLIHVPRVEHAAVVNSVFAWLKAGGIFVATMGAGRGGEWTGEFLGAPMYWSTWDADTGIRLVEAEGFDVVAATEETEDEDGRPVTHLWIVARRPALSEGRATTPRGADGPPPRDS